MPTNLLFLALLLFGFLFLAAMLWLKFSPKDATGDDESLYELWGAILTPAERSFAGVLEKSLPDGVRLLAKVRLADVFFTRKNLEPSRRTKARNRISQKHVDFLLVRASDFTPLAGIELDDQSHEHESRQARDRFVDQVFAGCNFPLLHIPAAATYSTAELRAKIDAALATCSRGR